MTNYNIYDSPLAPNLEDSVVQWSLLEYFILALGIIVVLYFILLFFRVFLRKWHYTSPEWRNLVYKVSVPKLRKKEANLRVEELREEISIAENIFVAIGGLKPQRGLVSWLFGRTDNFSFEIVSQNGLINFYVAVPEKSKEFIEYQLHSAYPHLSLEQVEDYNIFQPQSEVAAATICLKREYLFPLKTYKHLDNDPIGIITNTLSKITNEEGAMIQYVIRSAKSNWHYKSSKVASEMQQGKKLSEALAVVGLGSKVAKVLRFISLLFSAAGQKKPEAPAAPKQLSQMELEMIKGIEEKSSKAGLEVNIRVVVSSLSTHQANSRLTDIVNCFSQYSIYQFGNSLKAITAGSAKKLEEIVHRSIYRAFFHSYSLILNTEEMVSLWHMPLPNNETPNIEWLKARKAAPPTNLPSEGVVLGYSSYRGVKKEVRLKKSDRRRHVYIIGQTGTGKSTIMKNMMIQDMQNGEGCCVIDPHGDFALDMLKNVPKNRVDDVIYFNPVDTERPMSLNMLEHETAEQKTFVVNELLSIFDKLYDLKATGGPIFEQYMRNALLLVMEDPASGMTIMEVPRVLADEKFRKYKLSKCQNITVKEFWEKEAEKAGGEAALANMVPYITSKLTPFIANDIMRPIISQQKSSLNFKQIMNEGKILIVNLSKGKLGDINSSLLGMIVVGKLLLTTLSRVDIPEQDRKDFYLYIDEFQNFTTDSIAVILSEARKYKLNLAIAHQYIGQLVKNNNTSIKDAVFGNAGTTVAFRIGVEDAEIFAKQFAPTFDEFDVVNIPSFTAYIKLLIDNANPPSFNIAVNREPAGSQVMQESVIELSRLKYGRARAEVEKEIQERKKIGGAVDWEEMLKKEVH